MTIATESVRKLDNKGHPDPLPFLSVVLPFFNEGACLRENILHVWSYLSVEFPSHEIIAVDDGSDDSSSRVCRDLLPIIPTLRALSYSPNVGKGNAVRTGIVASRGVWVAVVDADLELPVEMLSEFFQLQSRSGASAVVGSKWLPGSVVNYPPIRRYLSRAFNIVTRVMFRLPVSDCQLGFKLFERSRIDGLVRNLLVKRFAFDLELLANLRLEGIQVVEAPVTLYFSRLGGGRIGLKSILSIVKESAGIWYRIYITRYYERCRHYRATQRAAPSIGTEPIAQ